MKRQLIWILVLVSVLLAACAGGPTAQSGATEITTAFVGDLAASASASGKVLPRRTAALSVATPGRVESVLVRVGDAVSAGDPLVQLEQEDLALAVDSARQDLAIQEANLLDLQTPATAEEIAAAEAAVADAQAQLNELLQGPRPQEVAAAEANVRAAEAGVWSASEQLDQAQTGTEESQIATARANLAVAQLELRQAEEENEDDPVESTHLALLDAQEAVAIAQAKLNDLLRGPNPDSVAAVQADVSAAAAQRDARQADLNLEVRGATEAQIASAEATLAQAEASLASLQAGPTEADLRAARAQVEQAQLSLADAEEALADATIRAPFDGVVTGVSAQEGEWASGVVAELMDVNSLRVVLTVDEADIGALEEGQSAVITLEAWPDEEIESEITRIAPAANPDDSALVSYEVFLSLGQTDLPVRAGMTANARLLTAQREGVLLVPNQAIIADREEGKYYVDLVVGEGEAQEAGGPAVERVEVTIGLRDDENTQITSGLEAGDRVQIGNTAARSPFGPDQEPQGGSPFGG